MITEKDSMLDIARTLALRWWYEHREKWDGSKDDFLHDRTAWEELKAACHNEIGKEFTHDETKALITTLDKSGLLGHENIDAAFAMQEQRKANIALCGTSEGFAGFQSRVSKMQNAINKGLSQEYIDYIVGGAWRRRSLRYLNEHCLLNDKWVCQMCGREHEILAHDRTIQVHHNTYSRLDGNELDRHLLGVCETPCHKMADIARKMQSGDQTSADINDSLRTLFSFDL